MVIGSSVDMLSEMGMRPVSGGSGGGGDGFGGDDLGKEIDLLLREQRRQEASDRERELNIYRSGSAPPSVEGSLGLFGGSSAAFADFGRNGNGFMSEEELRSDPAYVDYYYSHVNLNPRLPPPVLSKEDWRFAQRLQGGSSVLGGIGDRRKVNRAEEGGSRSLLRSNLQNEGDMEQKTGEWLNRGGDGLIGLSGLALGNRQKSLADIFQADNIGRSVPASGHPSRPASRNAFDESLETFDTAETQLAHLNRDISSVDGQMTGGNGQSAASVQPIGPSASHTFASVLGSSLSRSSTPDPQMVARAPSPGLPPVGVRIGATDKKTNNSSSHLNGVPSSLPESADILSSFSAMNLSRNLVDDEDSFQSKLQEVKDAQSYLFDAQGGKNNVKQHSYMKRTDTRHSNAIPHLMRSSYSDLGKNSGLMDLSNSSLMPEGQVDIPIAPTNSYLKAPSVTSMSSPGGSPSHYLSSDSAHYLSSDSAHAAFTGIGLGAYASNSPVQSMMANHIGTGNVPPLFENAAAASFLTPGLDSRALGGFSAGFNAVELQNLNRIANHAAATGLQMPPMDPLYLQYLRTAEYAAQFGPNLNNPSLDGTFAGNAYVDLLGLQKAYLGTLLPSQNQYNLPYLGKSGSLNHSYYGNPSFGLGMTYPGSPLMSPARTSPSGPGSPLRHGDRNMRFPSAMRNLSGGGMGSWNLDAVGNIDDTFGSSLLEEFKSNKTKCLELSEIAGHVVEFSADQYGSRFIQQKLETATIEEKNMVFEEIMPQALSLMTDVFGNYVIQKFFEHGTATQTRELANKLSGHVLTLSLQMYGCRVIQKAIEVVDLDQQTKMVAELDGHVMRCVRDQNGNHVIQKCIECIPQDAIQFIISSFYDQVVTLSTHPYGCRVIQRVLEHCDDPKTQQIVMDEIMQCVCMLAQDQYGNYVVQHVLEHGKPHERSAIIKQLAGQIVQMSQQKFASNVVEKCLSFGGPEERQLLVNEMLGSTDENEPLQAMMKDQFANYVVQKVLETCNDNQRELILSRIKVHLNALKKYTYGKHIVARVEKLVAAGERRIGVQSQYPS